MNIAIISPGDNEYSETFIEAHKKHLKGNIHFYFNGILPSKLENKGELNTLVNKVLYKLIGYFKKDPILDQKMAFLKSLKKNKISLVFAEYGNVGMKMIPYCRKLGIPLIVHFHGFDASVRKVIEDNFRYKPLFEFASKIIVVSSVMKQKLIDLGCPNNLLVRTCYGPNDEYLNLNKSKPNNTFFGIGRFVDKKAPYLTILAFSKIAKKNPKATLILGGDGPIKNTCHNLIKYLGLEGQVNLPGILSQKEIIGHMKSSLAFVQHSVTASSGDMEGTPVAILEASASGLPVISTNHAGIPDVIIHNQTGLLCDEHDVDQMSKNMETLLKDKLYTEKIGNCGRERISNNFSMQKHIETLNQVISDVAK